MFASDVRPSCKQTNKQTTMASKSMTEQQVPHSPEQRTASLHPSVFNKSATLEHSLATAQCSGKRPSCRQQSQALHWATPTPLTALNTYVVKGMQVRTSSHQRLGNGHTAAQSHHMKGSAAMLHTP